MAYIEGYVVAVPRANKDAYRKHAADAVEHFKKHGATHLVENWGDDLPDGEVTDFKRAVKAQPDEAVVFSWVEYPDKATRERANEAMMNDPAMKDMGRNMPFDAKRMIYAGFVPINDTGESGEFGYIDGCVIAVPAKNQDAYREMADKHALILKEYGATRTVDAWGDAVPDGKVTDFKGAVNAKPDEQVIFSWVEWPSKDARDRGWEQAMNDPRMKDMQMPFDGQRMIYGGFAPILNS